jgi:probable rRNA maturation factor
MEVLVSGDDVRGELLDRVRDAVAFALEAEGAPDDVEVSASLVGEAEIAELNKRYRGVSGPTDVLAFAYEDEAQRPSGAAFALGDIAISPAVAARQAAELGSSVEDEIEMLAVHGTLHLLGYEHGAADNAAADPAGDEMEQRQREILQALRRRQERDAP